MKEINLPSGNYLFVEVPDDVTDFYYDSWFTRYINHSKGSIKLDVNTEIISTTKDITEKQAESIIEFKTETLYPEGFEPYVTSGYRNYNIPYTGIFNIQRAKESLQSLIQANGMDVNKNYLILLKK